MISPDGLLSGRPVKKREEIAQEHTNGNGNGITGLAEKESGEPNDP